jgi:hypothetical protein
VSGEDDDRDASAEITRDIRARREFSLAGALAGQDDGGNLAGASPVAAQQQFAFALAQWLLEAVPGAEGSLRHVLTREIAGRVDLIGDDPDSPQGAVAAWLKEMLPRPAVLRDLVREVDAEWGRRQTETPRFEKVGQPPAADDPYTVAGVTETLRTLLVRAEREASP